MSAPHLSSPGLVPPPPSPREPRYLIALSPVSVQLKPFPGAEASSTETDRTNVAALNSRLDTPQKNSKDSSYSIREVTLFVLRIWPEHSWCRDQGVGLEVQAWEPREVARGWLYDNSSRLDPSCGKPCTVGLPSEIAAARAGPMPDVA